MNIEYEATFLHVDKKDVRQRLKKAGATLAKKEFLQRRVTFDPPPEHHAPGMWLRVRDEQDKITLSLKQVNGNTITDQKETCITVDDFDAAVSILSHTGCIKKSYQENYREKWMLSDIEITIDTWPFLETFVEVEGPSEGAVKKASIALGFDYSKAFFGSVDTLYARKYKMTEKQICTLPRITFEKDPFNK